MIKQSIYILLAMVLVSSCTPEPIDIDLPEAETKLVVASQVIPNSFMLITISKSFSALQAVDEDSMDTQALLNEILVSGAKVTISYSGGTDSLLSIPDLPGVYMTFFTPQIVNEVYTLNVYDPKTGLKVSSSTRMLSATSIDSVAAVRSVVDEMTVVDVELAFYDNPNEKNWYAVNIYQVDQDSVSTGNLFMPTDGTTKTILLDDADFGSDYFVGSTRLRGWNSDTIAVSLSNISKEYFDYLAVRQKSNGLFSSLTQEPINYPTNVIGGYGFFTTHFPDARIIILE